MATGVAQPITIEQLASMTPSDQQAYIAGLPADQQAVVQAQLSQVSKKSQMQAGADFLARTIRKSAICPMTNGGALAQAYPAAGGTLSFTVPQTLNGWLEGFVVKFVGTMTLGAGAGAVYALTGAGPLALFRNITLWYGNNQISIPARVIFDYFRLRRRLAQNPWESIVAGSGLNVAAVDTYLSNGNAFPVAVAANVWSFEVFIPCNWIHGLDVRGMLPISGGMTQPTVQITCSGAPFGTDAMINAVCSAGGAGHVATTAGTVTVIAKYRDGDSMTTRQKLALSVGGLGTMQAFYDGTLNGLVALANQNYQLKHIGRHYYVLAYVIDNVASTAFSTDANINQIDIVKDASGSNVLVRYGGDTNVNILEFFADKRRIFGQDMPEGVIPFVHAPESNVITPDNADGINIFDNTPGNGWPAANFRIQVAAVGAVGAGPRIEYYTIYENPQGLVTVG